MSATNRTIISMHNMIKYKEDNLILTYHDFLDYISQDKLLDNIPDQDKRILYSLILGLDNYFFHNEYIYQENQDNPYDIIFENSNLLQWFVYASSKENTNLFDDIINMLVKYLNHDINKCLKKILTDIYLHEIKHVYPEILEPRVALIHAPMDEERINIIKKRIKICLDHGGDLSYDNIMFYAEKIDEYFKTDFTGYLKYNYILETKEPGYD